MARIIDFDENYGVALSSGEGNVALTIAPAAEIRRHEVGTRVDTIESATHLVFRSAQQIDEFIAILDEAKAHFEGASDEG